MSTEEKAQPNTDYSMKVQTICLVAAQILNASQVSPEHAVGVAVKIYQQVEKVCIDVI